jgi:hypothetical protein
MQPLGEDTAKREGRHENPPLHFDRHRRRGNGARRVCVRATEPVTRLIPEAG